MRKQIRGGKLGEVIYMDGGTKKSPSAEIASARCESFGCLRLFLSDLKC